MYKRRARVVFVSVGAPRAAVLAQALAQRLGGQWIEPQAATVGREPLGTTQSGHLGPSLSAAPVALDDRLVHWADLLVCLDDTARCLCAAAPARYVYWADIARLSTPGADDSALGAALTGRIDGMIGGMRLLAGSDQAPD